MARSLRLFFCGFPKCSCSVAQYLKYQNLGFWPPWLLYFIKIKPWTISNNFFFSYFSSFDEFIYFSFFVLMYFVRQIAGFSCFGSHWSSYTVHIVRISEDPYFFFRPVINYSFLIYSIHPFFAFKKYFLKLNEMVIECAFQHVALL